MDALRNIQHRFFIGKNVYQRCFAVLDPESQAILFDFLDSLDLIRIHNIVAVQPVEQILIGRRILDAIDCSSFR